MFSIFYVLVILAAIQVESAVMGLDVTDDVTLLKQQLEMMQEQMLSVKDEMAIEKQEMQEQQDKMQQQIVKMQTKMEAERKIRLEQVEKMQQKMAREHREMHQQQQHMEKLETERQIRLEQVERMQQNMATEKKEMQQKMSDLEEENTNLKQKIDNVDGKLANVVHENQQLSESFNVLKLNLSQGFENVSEIVSQTVGGKHNGSFIGFSAYANATRDYDDGLTVLFDSVVTNVGSFYTPLTSIFICGHQGYYLFSVSVHTTTDDHMRADIVMDASVIATIYANNESDTSSNTVVVLCPQFSQVFVRARGDGLTMYGRSTYLHSMFTGLLLVQE